MRIIKFKREHFDKIKLQPNQDKCSFVLSSETFDVMERNHSYTFVQGKDIMACVGAFELDAGRGMGWSYIAYNIGSNIVTVTRAIKRFMAAKPYRRLEIDVDCDFEEAHRWAKMLGFTCEAERRRLLYQDGKDYALYARIL